MLYCSLFEVNVFVFIGFQIFLEHFAHIYYSPVPLNIVQVVYNIIGQCITLLKWSESHIILIPDLSLALTVNIKANILRM